MKTRVILISFLLTATVSIVNGQTVNASYLNPQLGDGGTLYKFLRFGTSNEYYGGIMWNRGSAYYGDGDDFSIFSYGNRDITIQTTRNFIVFPNAGTGGNVGIGTTDPQAKLAVDGNIIAKEVKVKTDISVPDYVFEPDYELASLKEVEAYVKEHKHLPEIPSAADIGRDGLDLAEMNLLLLKKVEELTLYLIDKENKVDELRSEVFVLKRLVGELVNITHRPPSTDESHNRSNNDAKNPLP